MSRDPKALDRFRKPTKNVKVDESNKDKVLQSTQPAGSAHGNKDAKEDRGNREIERKSAEGPEECPKLREEARKTANADVPPLDNAV